MKNLRICFFALLSLLIFALVSSGGCGGSSSNSVSMNNNTDEITDDEFDVGISGDVPVKAYDDPEVLRILDKIFALDENGVPAIFNYAPLPESYNNNQSLNGTPINFSEYVFSSDLNENGEFVKNFSLEKDNDYIIKYSRVGRTLDGSYLQFRITAPEDKVMILDVVGVGKSSSDEELELRGVVSKSIYVQTEKEVIPEEAPCIMLYSFKAPVTGNYEFAISEAHPFNLISNDTEEEIYNELPFEFRLYTPSEAYSVLDDEEIYLSTREILALQRILLEFAAECDEYGLPISFYDDEDYENYGYSLIDAGTSEQKINDLTVQAYGVIKAANNNSDKVTIAPRIDNVPYDSQYTPGAGFYAHSGLRSIQLTALYDDIFSDNALDDFTIKKPQGDFTMKSRLNTSYISTEDEFLRLKGLNNLNDFTLLKDALDNKMKGLAQLGLAGSKTLNLRYEYYESAPRMPEMSDIRVRSAVVKQLKKNFNTFQREHGDYFVAGYTYGMFYNALVEIKAEPYNCRFVTPDGKFYYDAEEIAKYIGDYVKDAFEKPDKTSELIADLVDKSLNPEGFVISTPPEPNQFFPIGINDPNSSFYWDNPKSPWYQGYHKHVRSYNVSVRIKDFSHSGSGGKSSISSLKDLAEDLADFKKRAEQTSSSEFERLYATLIRYREIENVKKIIPEELPISAEHHKLIRELNKIIYLTRCYKNAVDSIPASHLMNGETKRQEWSTEFDGVFNLYNNQLNRLCSDINFVREYYNKFSSLLEKYQGLNHRYVFYRYFLARQKGTSNGVGDWKDSDDKWSYPHFRIGFNEDDVANNKFIKEDIKRGKENSHGGPYGEVGAFSSAPDDFYERSGTFDKSYRVYYYKGGPINSNYSKGTDLRGHSLGKRSYHWKFERSTSLRRLEFQIEFRLVDMPDDLYPFVGLED